MTVCPNCGSNSEDDSIFCEECGFQIKSKISVASQTKDSMSMNSPPTSPNPPKEPSNPKKIRFVRSKK
jgi:uncharacterized membrane protein YvbJ